MALSTGAMALSAGVIVLSTGGPLTIRGRLPERFAGAVLLAVGCVSDIGGEVRDTVIVVCGSVESAIEGDEVAGGVVRASVDCWSCATVVDTFAGIDLDNRTMRGWTTAGLRMTTLGCVAGVEPSVG